MSDQEKQSANESPIGLPIDLTIDTVQARLLWVQRRIVELQLEHRGLDGMLAALEGQSDFDALQIRRLKKRKLQIKDTIVLLQMQLVPDIPA